MEHKELIFHLSRKALTLVTKHKSSIIRIGFGIGALFLGGLEYLFARPSSSSHVGRFINEAVGGFPKARPIYGEYGQFLPDLLHPFAFALLTMAIFPEAGRRWRMIICMFWMGVNLVFECGQRFAHFGSSVILSLFPGSKVSLLVSEYFTTGTYDPVDIFAVCLGAILAFIIGELTSDCLKRTNSRNFGLTLTNTKGGAHDDY